MHKGEGMLQRSLWKLRSENRGTKGLRTITLTKHICWKWHFLQILRHCGAVSHARRKITILTLYSDLLHEAVFDLGYVFEVKTNRVAIVFSERELKFMFAICHRRSVCRLSVCRLSSVCRL